MDEKMEKEKTETEEEQVATEQRMEKNEMLEKEENEEPLEIKEELTEEALEAEEEVKPPPREEELEEDIIEERVYTVPLRKAWISPPNKRAPRAIRILKNFIVRHMKLEPRGEEEEPKRLIVSNEVNERIWSRGIEKPPRKIRVRAAKDKEGNVTIYLAEGD
jgi:large subunit ribosomal protein L31e